MRRILSVTFLLAGMLAMAPGTIVPATAQEAAIVSTRVIYPGQPVPADALKEITLSRRPHGTVVRMSEEIVGKVARRTLLPGRLIPEGSVREPYLVETGSPCTVKYEQGALTISTVAVPLQSGSAGDVVKMRNMDSGTVFSGIVLGDGTVMVGAS